MQLDPERSDRLKERMRALAPELGLSQVGFASAEPGVEVERFRAWLALGHAGSMAWLERDPGRRGDPRAVLPEARTVVVASALYDGAAPRTADALAAAERAEPGRPAGWISRYAWGDDYHGWLLARVEALRDALLAELGDDVPSRVYVDTGPVLEKAAAERAGLGWIGKNACLISPELGSFLFLGVVLLGAEIEPDAPGVDRCGSCRACLDVCPTDAFPEPYVLDARRCISYLSIEHRGEIEPDLESAMGAHVFGCDLCQDVCPWTRKSPRVEAPGSDPRPGLVAPDLIELAALDDEAFRERFRGSPLKRTKRRGLARNVAIALGNAPARGASAAARALDALDADPDPTVVATARRARERLGGAE